jgi:predicted nucleic acid-binding protein
MIDRIYIDTNILVYLYSETGIKSVKVRKLINSDFNQIVISTQILNELFNILAIKLKLKTN